MSDLPPEIPKFLDLGAHAHRSMRPVLQRTEAQTAAEPAPTEALQLHELWYESWQAVGAKGDGQAALEQLLSAYHDQSRHVHNAQQLLNCFSILNRWRSHTNHFHQVALALWFCDAVLDPQRHDNEARSARVASDHLNSAGVATETIRRIRDLIIATRIGEQLASEDACLIHDIDLAILAASDQEFDRFERNLRYENGHLVDFIYRRKRIEQLQSLLSRPPLFASEIGQAEFHFPAEANLRRWLQIWQQNDCPIADRSPVEAGLIHTV